MDQLTSTIYQLGKELSCTIWCARRPQQRCDHRKGASPL